MKLYPVVFLLLYLTCCSEQPAAVVVDSTGQGNHSDTSSSSGDRGFGGKLEYTILRERKDQRWQDDSLGLEFDRWLAKHPGVSVDSIIDYNLLLVKQKLQFSFGKVSNDPGMALKEGKANCVGYASLFTALMNYSLKKRGLDDQWQCRHYVGKILYEGKAVNELFNDPFFSDHDFTVISGPGEAEPIAVDPSLFDYLGISRVKLKR